MPIHPTDRNIVNAHSMHSLLDLSFGPSDDDFHYQRHHATVSHDAATVDANEIDIKLVFQGGGCEVQWATGDHCRDEYRWDGFANISPDGKLSFPFWSVDEATDNQKVPFWVEFTHTGLKVFTYEGEPPADERDKWLVFDSNNQE
jgi:hypothetical protein